MMKFKNQKKEKEKKKKKFYGKHLGYRSLFMCTTVRLIEFGTFLKIIGIFSYWIFENVTYTSLVK